MPADVTQAPSPNNMPQPFPCPTGTVMVGLTGAITGGNAWGTLAPECTTLSVGSPDAGLLVTTGSALTMGPVTGTGLPVSTTIVECPSGSAVTSFTGQVDNGNFLRNVTLECTAVAITYSAPDHYTVAVIGPTSLDAGTSGGSTPLTPYSAMCPMNDVACGISATGGGAPLLYGLQCAPLAP